MIRFKLQIAATFLLVIGILSVLWVSNSIFSKQSTDFIFETSTVNAKQIASQMDKDLANLIENARLLSLKALEEKDPLWSLQTSIENSSKIEGVQILSYTENRLEFDAFRAEWAGEAASFSIDVSQFTDEEKSQVNYHGPHEKQSKLHFVDFPLQMTAAGDKILKGARVFFKEDIFKTYFQGNGISLSVFFDANGKVILSSPSLNQANGWSLEKGLPKKVLELIKNPVSSGTTAFENQLGAFAKPLMKGFAVGYFVPESIAFEAPRLVTKRSLLLGVAILCFSLVFAMFFANSFVKPILSLVAASEKVADGDFQIELSNKSKDEIGILTRSFNHMTRGLAERERLKGVFNKFHSKAIVEQLLKDEKTRLGGSRMPATIFFSDIRSFTSTSESMQPEQVVEMINEYMTVMVGIVEKHGGVVDKFVGDAIMGVWGHEGGQPSQHAEHAVEACLEMRQALEELNERREARGDKPIKIGMGLNSGEVISGNIGSPSRMEFTVIGDAVNVASRMESLTKEFQTDFLISGSTYEILPPGKYQFDGPYEAQAKGKAAAVPVYKILGHLVEQQLAA
jgi:adenylate cyclase